MATCFVVMGFGKKTDFESGRTLDLDKSYQNLIKPAVEAAGLQCVRADEIVHSGMIDVPMYEQLLGADVVVADLSTSNNNAFYELGIRHALRPYTTIVVAENGLVKVPFDVNRVVVRRYNHLGEDIGYSEVMRFREDLRKAIVDIVATPAAQRTDSPVYTILQQLQPPAMGAKLHAVAPPPPSGGTHSELMKQVDEAQAKGEFLQAKTLLSAVRALARTPNQPEEPYIVQRLALLTYKSAHPTPESALLEARSLLEKLDPQTSNDTETLGLWGAIHKRLWGVTRHAAHLDDAVRAYGRGFYLRNDHYNGINLAFLLNVRAAESTDANEALTDVVMARRVRTEVVSICEQWRKSNQPPTMELGGVTAQREYGEKLYWVLATLGEALIGLGDPRGDDELEKAYALAPNPWMIETTESQIKALKQLLQKTAGLRAVL
jgi:hypothetical protein